MFEQSTLFNNCSQTHCFKLLKTRLPNFQQTISKKEPKNFKHSNDFDTPAANIQSLFARKSLKIGKVEHNEAVYWLKFPSNLRSWPKRFQKLSKTVQWLGEWDKPYQPRYFYCTKSSMQLLLWKMQTTLCIVVLKQGVFIANFCVKNSRW